jgi:hypothetical protein
MKIPRMNSDHLHRLPWRRVLSIVGLAACLCAALSAVGRAPDRSGRKGAIRQTVPVTIDWAMAPRFGPGCDGNRDGRPDLPNSHEYVNPGRYQVQLAACVEASAAPPSQMSCTWTIDSLDGSVGLRSSGASPTVDLPEGTYSVTVTLLLADGRTGQARETIRVNDILIVAMGDSLATGEGNPEVPAGWEGTGTPPVLRGQLDPPQPPRWADGGPDGDQPRVTPARILAPANILHAKAHRSTHSAPAQLAMRLEAADLHTSVTFVCVAATGARTVDFFQGERSGENQALGPGPPLPAQLDELHAILGSRPAEILILGIGLNDARFMELLGELVRREIRCIDPLRLLVACPTRRQAAAAQPADIDALVDDPELSWLNKLDPKDRRGLLAGDIDLIYDVAELAAAGLTAARDQLDRLGTAITQDPLLGECEVYLLEYPDPTGDAEGTIAQAILNEVVPGVQVNRRELVLAQEWLLRPLNRALHQAAAHQNWTFVGGIAESFRSHGYAAPDPWFVRAKESEQLQGPRLTLAGYLRGKTSPGTLHPNRCGHQVIADRLFQNLAAPSRCRLK